MVNNAMVTMPLREVDDLRDALKKSQDEVQELKSRQKEIMITVVENYTSFSHRWDRLIPETKRIAHPVKYVNMQDVIDPIRQEEELKVADKLHAQDKENKELNEKLRKKNDKINDLERELEDVKQGIIVVKENEIKDKELKDLRNMNLELKGKITSYERFIANAKKQNWIQRLFKPVFQ